MKSLILIALALNLAACKQASTDHAIESNHAYQGKADIHEESLPWRDEQLRKRVRQVQADRE